MKKEQFQFHLGAINSLEKFIAQAGQENFNSTLVRLTAIMREALKEVERISIPPWCD